MYSGRRETVVIGLQQNDTCRIITADKERIFVKAIKTRSGYTRLELDLPEGFHADRIAYRNREQLEEDT